MPATTGGPNVLAENIYYLGWAKQSVWGTAVAPTVFSHWLDGTTAEPNLTQKTEREGDTGPFITLAYKQRQMWQIQIVEYIRPITVGYILQALLGTGSDTFTAPTASSTLSSPIVAGTNTFSVAASIGTTSTGFFNFTPGYSSANYEVQNVNLGSKTGAGPFTYTLQSGTFQNAHSSSDVVSSASSHVFTRQNSTYDAYAFEIGRGNIATFGDVFRITNCVCTQVKMTSAVGMPVKLESTWVGSFSAIMAAATSVSLEGNGVVGQPGSPLVHFMAGSSWNVDGGGAGVGLGGGIKQLVLTLKNSTKPEDMQSELIYSPYFIPGVFDIDAQLTAIFESYSQYKNTYYGSASATTGATDSYLMGYGSLGVTWTGDGVNSLALSLPNVAYTAAKIAPPKRDGTIVNQPITVSAQKTLAFPTPITLTLLNSSAVVY